MENFKTVLSLAGKYQSLLSYSALTFLAAVGENVFSSILYKCPCNRWSYNYGLVFLLVPSLIFFLLGIMLNGQLWKQTTGCCTPPSSDGKIRYWYRRRLYCLWTLLQVMFVSSLPPLTWIALALLKTSYYECIVTGVPWDYMKKRFCGNNAVCTNEFLLLPCASTYKLNLSKTEIEDIQGNIRAESQVIGWTLIASVLLTAVFFICMCRCCSSISYLQLMFWKTYIEVENKRFDESAKEHATKLAERNVKGFFTENTPEPFQTPSSKMWSRISTATAWNINKQYYSPLHKFVESNNSSVRLSHYELPPAEINVACATALV